MVDPVSHIIIGCHPVSLGECGISVISLVGVLCSSGSVGSRLSCLCLRVTSVGNATRVLAVGWGSGGVGDGGVLSDTWWAGLGGTQGHTRLIGRNTCGR